MDNFSNDELKNIFIKLFKKTYLLEFDDGKYLFLPEEYNGKKPSESILDYYVSDKVFIDENTEYICNELIKNKIRKYEQDIKNLQHKIAIYKQPSNFSCFHDSPSDQHRKLFVNTKVLHLSSGEDPDPYIELIYNILIEIIDRKVSLRFNKKNNTALKNYLAKRHPYFLLSSLYSNRIVWLEYDDYMFFLHYAYKTKSRFILWFSIRYYFNHTLSLKEIPARYHYFRIMESLYYGIIGVNMFKNAKKHAMFYSCIDIFRHLNFNIDNIKPASSKITTYYDFMKTHYKTELDILSQTINANYNNLNELDIIAKLDMLDIDVNTLKYKHDFLEFASIDNILEPFRKYLENKVIEILPPEVQMANNSKEQTFFLINNIFATDNPNRYDFWKGVKLYSHKIPSNRNTLLLIDMHKSIRLNFRHIEQQDKYGNYFILLYDSTFSNNRYVIDCQDLKDRNIKFMWYDRYKDKFIPLYGVFTPNGNKLKEYKYECACDNKYIKGEYDPALSNFKIFYRNKTFEFINYDKKINGDPEYSKEMTPTLSSSDTNAQYSLVSITLKAGTMNASSQISTISPSGAVKIKLTANITDNTKDYLPPYKLETYPYYMYLCETSELIEGVIKEEEDKLLLEFLINKENITSNLHAGFSLSLKRLLATHSKDSKCNDTKLLNHNTISKKLYEGYINLNRGDLPLIITIKQAFLISRYKNIIKLSATYKEIGMEVLNINKEKCIRWGYIEYDKNMYGDNEIGSIINNGKKHLLTKTNSDTEAVYGKNISIVRDEWTQENLLNNNKSVLIFAFSVSAKTIYDNKAIDINYIYENNKQSCIILGRRNSNKSINGVSRIYRHDYDEKKDKNKYFSKIKLEAIHGNYPDDTGAKTYWCYALSDNLNNKNISLEIDKLHVSNITVSACGTCLAQNILSTSSQKINNNEIYQLPLYGRVVEINYQQSWFGKSVYFFPYSRTPEYKISEVWHIEQLISLKFNGEKLQILEAGKVLKEYEARSGLAEKKRTDISNDTQEIPYPAKSSNKVDGSMVDLSNKYFYYDEKSVNKLAEGSII